MRWLCARPGLFYLMLNVVFWIGAVAVLGTLSRI